MKRLWCFALTLLLITAGCSRPPGRSTLPSSVPEAPAFIRIGTKEGNRITVRSVPFEEYVRAAIISEFAPASGQPDVVERMFEVQAVIGRTYALAHLGRHRADGFDLCATTHCQLYQPSRVTTSRWAAETADAVRRTAGAVLWFDGAPATAVFHADCGGHTSSADHVWGGTRRPYLVSIADDGPAESAHAKWRYEASLGAVLAALNKDPRTRVGKRLDGLQVLDRDEAGRAGQVAIHGSQELVVRGETLREVLGQALGARTVRSTGFDVRRTATTYVFEGRGFGHGVGLCQAGALARIRAGEKLTAILQRYYPGTRLTKVRTVDR
jgi:stage II sporulation protein D